jgi:hypothetical protein
MHALFTVLALDMWFVRSLAVPAIMRCLHNAAESGSSSVSYGTGTYLYHLDKE